MNKNDDQKRSGFHSIESIIKNNPHKIKKLFLPSSREDKRINNLIKMANENDINYEISKKLKQDPEALISNVEKLNFKDLKEFIDKAKDKELLILIPPEEEQIKIANILGKFENFVDKLEGKILKYEILKQSLLSDLLTGKIKLILN